MTVGIDVRVELDGVTYFVRFFEDGKPQSIKKRVLRNKGHKYLEAWHNQSYWHHSRELGAEWTKPSRIVALALPLWKSRQEAR